MAKGVTIKIEATMSERWVDHFCSMLKYLESNGKLGHSCIVGFYSDGDGDFRPEFKFDCEYKVQEGIRDIGEMEVMFDAGQLEVSVMINKYRKKPVVIEAVQWTGDNKDEIRDFIDRAMYTFKNGALLILTLEGDHKANIGDFIIKGVNGEFYPCKPEIFEKTYEIVVDPFSYSA